MWFFRRKKHQTPSTWEPTQRAIEYHDEDGRRHRADAPYLLPKDEKEISRLDYQHYLFRHILQGNCFAPVATILRKGGNVLDVGCGTGRWGQEIATMYPHTLVYGFDLEPLPGATSTPINYQFYQGNLLNGLPFAAHQFQYVHQRLLVAGLPLEKWPFVVSELKRVTMPGGWIELIEMGAVFHQAGPATNQMLTWGIAVSASRGIDASQMAHLDAFLQRAGCVDIQSETKQLPVGNWGGRIGNLLAQDILAGWPSMRSLAHTQLGVSPQIFDEVIGQLEREWNVYQTRYEVYFACGRA